MTMAADVALAIALHTRDPMESGENQIEIGDLYCVARSDWTGLFPSSELSPDTGDSPLVQDVVREMARRLARVRTVLAVFPVDDDADRAAEEFMRRTAPPVAKRPIVRR